jgi:two-component system, OmpR family, response regulator
MKILVIEDDCEAAATLFKGLTESGHCVDSAAEGHSGLERAREGGYDAMIVDRMLPGLDGLSLVAALRAGHDNTPVVVVSALGDVEDRVTGLRAGCDDYLSKPFAFTELLARLEAVTRHGTAETRLAAADLEIDLITRKVMRAGRAVDLLPREFKLLEYLMRNEGHIVTRTMLLEKLWGYHFDPQTNVIDVHISRLRQKIDKGFDYPLLHTERGVGYMIRARAPVS